MPFDRRMPVISLLERLWPITPCAGLVASVSDIGGCWRTGLIDREGTGWLVKYLSVEGFNGCICLVVQGHLNEGEAFGAARITVTNDGHRIHLAVGTE